MTTRSLVAADLLALVDAMPTRDLCAETLTLSRDRMALMYAGVQDSAILCQQRAVQGPPNAPDVNIRIFHPDQSHDKGRYPGILHIHGGGMVAGMAAMNDAANARLAAEQRAVVVSVDYRLAPETPFPGPVEDCVAVLDWMQRYGSAINIDPARIVVTGESAGGGLAAATALIARDRAMPSLAGQLLIYPMLDPRTGSPEGRDNPSTGEFIWTRGSNQFGWAALRGRQDIAPDRLGHYAPALATDLSALPPTMIAVGALDLFLDEDLDYAVRLVRAGVAVECHVYPGAVHGFDLISNSAAALMLARDVEPALRHMLRDRTAT